jgi:hypothetical protein
MSNNNFTQFFARTFDWRVNPALAPRAATVQKAKAKILAASIVAHAAESIEPDELPSQAAFALLDKSSSAYSAFYAQEVWQIFPDIPFGSGNFYRRDGGGYIGNYARKLCTDIVARGVKPTPEMLWHYNLLELAFQKIFAAAHAVNRLLKAKQVTSDIKEKREKCYEALLEAVKEFHIDETYGLPFNPSCFSSHEYLLIPTSEPDENGFLSKYALEVYFNRAKCSTEEEHQIIDVIANAPVGQWVHCDKPTRYRCTVGTGWFKVLNVEKVEKNENS